MADLVAARLRRCATLAAITLTVPCTLLRVTESSRILDELGVSWVALIRTGPPANGCAGESQSTRKFPFKRCRPAAALCSFHHSA